MLSPNVMTVGTESTVSSSVLDRPRVLFDIFYIIGSESFQQKPNTVTFLHKKQKLVDDREEV